MRKIITTALAVATLGGAALAGAGPAAAYPHGGYHGGGYYHGGYGRGYGYGYGGVALAGLAGLAIGATLASPGPYYAAPPPYYGDSYYAGPYQPYATCYQTRRVWDGYRWVYERSPYAC